MNRVLFRYPRAALLLLVLAAYWPLSLGIAALKNDALLYFLPFRHALSESFAQGSLPLWSPYLFTGLPVHADMQSGMWNPVAMALAFVFRYNMTVLTAEVVLYFTLGAWGFYSLGRYLRWSAAGAFILAAAYILQGFFGDSASFIPWVAAGAWLPWVLLYWKRTLDAPGLRPAAGLALFGGLLLTCGYPSFFIVTGYGLAAFTLFLSFHRPYRLRWLAIWGALLGAAAAAALLALPALLSWIDFLPYYERGSGVGRAASLSNPYSLKSLLSLAVPPAAYPLQLANDISSRNGSVALLLLPLAVLATRSGGRAERAIAAATFLTFLLSLGGAIPLRAWAWDLLPGWNVFRHPSTLRLFTGTGLLLLAGTGLQFETLRHKGAWVQRSEKFLLLVLAGLWLSALLRNGGAELWHALTSAGQGEGRSLLKAFYDAATPAAWLVIGLPVQAALVRWLAVRQRIGIPHAALPPLLVQLLLFSTLSFPYTLISRQQPEAVNAFVRRGAEEDALAAARQPLRLVREDTARSAEGYAPFYSRRITLQDAFVTPTVTKAYGALLQDTARMQEIEGTGLGILDSGAEATLLTVTPNRFLFSLTTPQKDTLRFRQQYHHHWRARVNGAAAPVMRSEGAFMAVPVPAGRNEVLFTYRPMGILLAAGVSALLLLTLLFLTFPLHVPKARF